MEITVHTSSGEMSAAAAADGADKLRAVLARDGSAGIVVATGASQFEVLEHLIAQPDIDWLRITAFHLDEYVGLPVSHPASFRRYLNERFVEKIPNLGEFVSVKGDATDLDAEVSRLNDRLSSTKIGVCFAGIGENCHLAFNDPPADFDVLDPYIVVKLDEACRRQQMGEGWFKAVEDVPERAISMSIRQMMASEHLILAVPDARKAQAVHDAVDLPISNRHPASIVQDHPSCSLHLDRASAGLMNPKNG